VDRQERKSVLALVACEKELDKHVDLWSTKTSWKSGIGTGLEGIMRALAGAEESPHLFISYWISLVALMPQDQPLLHILSPVLRLPIVPNVLHRSHSLFGDRSRLLR